MTMLKPPKDFKGVDRPDSLWCHSIMGYSEIPYGQPYLYINYEYYSEPLTNEILQKLIEETKEFYDNLINLRDALK